MQRVSRDLKRKCIDVRKSNKEDEKPWEMTTRVLLKNVQSLRDCLDGCAAKGKEEITSFDVLRGLLNDSDKSLFQSSGSRKKASISPFVKTAVLLHLHFEISRNCEDVRFLLILIGT